MGELNMIFPPVNQLNLTIALPVPASAVCFYYLDSHQPWGSPQDQAQGGWARWPACGWVAPHTDSGSDVGDSASSSSVSWAGGNDEGTISDLAKVLIYRQ